MLRIHASSTLREAQDRVEAVVCLPEGLVLPRVAGLATCFQHEAHEAQIKRRESAGINDDALQAEGGFAAFAAYPVP